MVQAGRPKDPAAIGVRAGKVINTRKVARHFTPDIGERSFSWRRDQASLDADGVEVDDRALAQVEVLPGDLAAASSGSVGDLHRHLSAGQEPELEADVLLE